MQPKQFPTTPEPWHTVRDAAAILNIKEWALRRAIKSGRIRGYKPLNGRIQVRLSEVVAGMEAAKIGGAA